MLKSSNILYSPEPKWSFRTDCALQKLYNSRSDRHKNVRVICFTCVRLRYCFKISEGHVICLQSELMQFIWGLVGRDLECPVSLWCCFADFNYVVCLSVVNEDADLTSASAGLCMQHMLAVTGVTDLVEMDASACEEYLS